MSMSLPLRVPALSYDSRSSSVYTEDESVSEANTNGTLVHHRSHLHPTIGGMPREHGQIFERPSDLSLSQDHPTLNQEGIAPDLHNVNTVYRFETETEAALRRLKQRDRNCKEREKHLQVWKKGLLPADVPDTTQEVDETRLRPYSWNFDDDWFLQNHPELEPSDSSSSGVHLSAPSTASPHPLPGSTTTNGAGTEESMHAGEGRMKLCLEVPNTAEYQGSTIDDLQDAHPVEADLRSKSGRKYDLGDHGRGYISGNYVTELGGHGELPQERHKKRDWVKNIFCLRF